MSNSKLQGPFFSSEGLPTPHWREVEDLLSDLSAAETAKGELRRKYPSCNSHYDQSAGKAEVWCTEKRLIIFILTLFYFDSTLFRQSWPVYRHVSLPHTLLEGPCRGLCRPHPSHRTQLQTLEQTQALYH